MHAMPVSPDVRSVPIRTIKPNVFAAMMLSQGLSLAGLSGIKERVARTQCVQCGHKIGPGRAGRKCKECLAK